MGPPAAPRRRIVALVVLLAAAAISLPGCATPAPPGQCRVRVVLSADQNVNLDMDGQSLPTPVSFWQLKDIAPMSEASFADIWQRSEATLGDSVVEVKVVTLFPGQKKKEDYLIAEETRYVAATAIFRQPGGTTWRTYVKLPPAQTVERCEEGKVGGPLYIHASGNQLLGSNKPFPMSTSKPAAASKPAKASKPTKASDAAGGAKDNDQATGEGEHDGDAGTGDGSKKKKHKKRKRKKKG